jgi:hypothetical protein
MKKIILIAISILTVSICVAQPSLPRFGVRPNEDNTGRVLKYEYRTPAASTNMTVSPNAYKSVISFTNLTVSPTMTVSAVNGKICDELIVIIGGVASQSITFVGAVTTTGASNVLTALAAKRAVIRFIFDGTRWLELSRAIQP